MPAAIKRDTVSGEALFILRNLKENQRLGRSNKLADVKAALEPSVSLEFDSYFFFLRKFHYIAMDREAQLRLTDQGEAVIGGEYLDKFASEIGEFFSEQLHPAEMTDRGALADPDAFLDIPPMAPPPPPPDDTAADAATPPPEEALLLPEEEMPPSSPPGSRARRPSMPPPPPTESDEPILSQPPPNVTSRVDVPDLRRDPPPAMPISNPTTAQFGQGGAPNAAAAAPPRTTGSSGSAAGGGGASAGGGSEDARYARFDPVGSGPIGTVFKGRQNALGLEVCVKELKDIFSYFSFLQRGEVLKRLKKELCAQAAVRHPSVVAVIDQSVESGKPFYVTELCRGSLRERLDQGGGKGLSVVQSLRWFLQAAYALRAAHQSGLWHHNLKPENVLFDALGNAKVSDFGLARVIEVDPTKGMPQVFVGTGGMPYLAPELISRGKDAGASADVYGLGILLYEMLTGQLPGRRSPMPSEVNNEVPSKLDPIFDKMTQDRRELRYPDFDAVLSDFYGAFSEGEFLGRNDLVLWSAGTPAA